MTTIFKRPTSKSELGAALAAVLALGLIAPGSAHGQPPVSPLQIIALAQGFTPSKTPNMHVVGATDVLQSLLVFQAGAETGWHVHPGPVVVVVKSGAITETHANGCITVHPAGSVFFESAGEVHNATNNTASVAEVYATFLSPAGSPPLISVMNPGRTCSPGDDHHDDK
jgi:quercetin dioxygenase-like cupin family protein